MTKSATKRIVSLLLVFCMIFSTIPGYALESSVDETGTGTVEINNIEQEEGLLDKQEQETPGNEVKEGVPEPSEEIKDSEQLDPADNQGETPNSSTTEDEGVDKEDDFETPPSEGDILGDDGEPKDSENPADDSDKDEDKDTPADSEQDLDKELDSTDTPSSVIPNDTDEELNDLEKDSVEPTDTPPPYSMKF